MIRALLSTVTLFHLIMHIIMHGITILIKIYKTPNGYIVPMEFRVHFFPRIRAFLGSTKMHLNGMFLIGTEFFEIIVPL